LISAIHGAFDFKASAFNYFPSYEIMMDELRDYRFYADDMLHPSQLAIDYIWKAFQKLIFRNCVVNNGGSRNDSKVCLINLQSDSESVNLKLKDKILHWNSIFIYEILIMLRRLLVFMG
jgi:hypothetical protein